MSQKHIETLPSEIIHHVFSQLGDDNQTIRSVRLVSRRFNSIGSSYLIQDVSVRMTPESLAHFEMLCNHPIFSKSIRTVTVGTDYYDNAMAEDRGLYARHCSSALYQYIELGERTAGYRRRAMRHSDDGEFDASWFSSHGTWKLPDQIRQISEPGFEESSANPYQKLILELYSRYKERCLKQEELRQGDEHLTRISAAFGKLANLNSLRLGEGLHRRHIQYRRNNPVLRPDNFTHLDIPKKDLIHFDLGLRPSGWNGSFTTAYVTAPPTELLGELCSRLGQSGLRPRHVAVSLSVPANLRRIQVTPEQQSGIRLLVSQATTLAFDADHWARKGSLAENNNRPRDEMLALCSFTSAFFSAPNLRDLICRLDEYPRFYEVPTVSMKDLLPISTPWPELQTVNMRCIPSTIQDLVDFVAIHHNSITSLTWVQPYLLSGTWSHALSTLTDLTNLEAVSIKYPKGDRYGDGRGVRREKWPEDEAQDYILGRSVVNPLDGDGASSLQG